tara:strand:- start:582 stop:1490 length:909 start_codon:yes stop_codon:yes gene_type:complete
MNILINGLNSFTGILLVKSLLKKGHKVIALSSGNLTRLTPLQKEGINSICNNQSFKLIKNKYNLDNEFSLDDFEIIDTFIIHGFKAFDYKNLNLDSLTLMKDSLYWLEPLPSLLRKKSCKLVAYTGTYFENFSPELQTPYSLAKSMGWLYIKKLFSEFKLLKYLFLNPYGSLESQKFTASIIKKWINRESVNLEYPFLIRDNIPAEFMIDDYIANLENMFSSESTLVKEFSPSYIVENNLEFASRFSSKLMKFGYECKLNISENKLCNSVRGTTSIREKYIHLEDDFIDKYLRNSISNNFHD